MEGDPESMMFFPGGNGLPEARKPERNGRDLDLTISEKRYIRMPTSVFVAVLLFVGGGAYGYFDLKKQVQQAIEIGQSNSLLLAQMQIEITKVQAMTGEDRAIWQRFLDRYFRETGDPDNRRQR